MAPHVTLALERRGWCFENIALQVSKGLSRSYEFRIGSMSELTSGTTDVLVSLWWANAMLLKANLKIGSLISCVYDCLSWKADADSKAQFRLVLGYSDALGVCNKDIAKEIKDVHGSAVPPIFLIPDGVDTQAFPYLPLPGKIVLGWTGNASRHTPGGPPDQKGLEIIKAASAQEEIKLRILDTTDGGEWPHSRMPVFYQDISVYVCMSYTEGTPNPILEAMSCGRPVISTPVGLVPELIQHGVNGWIVEDRTLEALQEVISQARALPQAKLEQMGREARTTAINASWDRRMKSWSNMIQFALGCRAPNPGVVSEVQCLQGAGPKKHKKPVEPEKHGTMSQDATSLAPLNGALRREKRLTNDARPKVLCLADQPGWAFENGHRDMAQYLSDRFIFRIHLIHRWPQEPLPDLDEFDIIYVPYTNWRMNHLFPMERCLSSLRSQWFPREYGNDPGPEQYKLVNGYKGFHVVTRQNYEDLAPHCPNVIWLPNPINIKKFPWTAKPDSVIAQWNGNAGRLTHRGVSVKGFHEIIKPACASGDIHLNYAEYTERRLLPEQMPSFYAQSNLFIHASLFEGCSKALLESMCTRHAVISTDVGQISEMHQQQMDEYGDSGIILLDRDLSSYINAIERLKNDPTRVAHMGHLNHQCVKRWWSWGAWADRYANFLEMAL